MVSARFDPASYAKYYQLRPNGARTDTVKNKPDLVQRFVDASALGWVNYLYGNRKAANAMMIKDNHRVLLARLGPTALAQAVAAACRPWRRARTTCNWWTPATTS